MRSLAPALGGLLLFVFVHGASAQTTPAPPAEQPGAEAKDKDKGARRPQVRTYSTVTVLDDPAKAPPLPIPRRDQDPAREVRRPSEAPGPGEPAREERRNAAGASETAKERAAVRELRDHLRSERSERRDQPEPRPEPRPETDRPAPRAPEARGKDRPEPRERLNERTQRRERAIERLRLRKE